MGLSGPRRAGHQCPSGDGGPATRAGLWGPLGVAVDTAGNLYIADTSNHGVRKVDSGGTITTVAGTGVEGFSGDGGSATSAALNRPSAVAVDAGGNLYIADSFNQRVRKVSPAGTISTVAGGGGSGGDGIPATSAFLAGPSGVATDMAGNLFIADESHRIRKVSASGIIITVAGNGIAGFSGDGGPATSASLNAPDGVTVDAAGNLYVADRLNYRVRRVNPAGTRPPNQHCRDHHDRGR